GGDGVGNAKGAGHGRKLKEWEGERSALGFVLQSSPIRTAADVKGSLHAALQANAQAIVTMDDPVVQSQRARIVAFAMAQRLPVMSEFRPATEAGTLMSYGPNQIDLWRRSAAYVDKILRSANPADLPVEQPIKFEVVGNLKTPKALGITISPSVLAMADEVIE